MAALIPSSQQMQQFLASRSPAEIAAIIAAIQAHSLASQPQAAATAATNMSIVASPQSNHSNGQSVIPLMTHVRPALPGRANRRLRNAVLANSAKRPLNSWMAFRSYYSPIFLSQQQKDISGFLTVLWQDDPFKAKWSILAKAYSVIRDHKGKSVAPLDIFLAIACPHIGMIGPGDYLPMLGWEMVDKDGEKTMNRRYDRGLNALADHLRTTNLSVEDIIRHCLEVGYIVDDKLQGISSETTTSSAVPSLTMTARPTTTFTSQVDVANARRRTKLARRARNGGRRIDPLPGSLPSFAVDWATPPQLSLSAAHPTQSIDANGNLINNSTHHTVVAPGGPYSMGAAGTPYSAYTNSVAGLHPCTSHNDTHLGSVTTTGHEAGNSQQYEVSASVASSENEVPPRAGCGYVPYGEEFGLEDSSANIDAGADMAAQIARLQEMEDQYPFNGQFDPSQNFGLNFDPINGDGFNTYNISHFDVNGFIDPSLLNF